MQTLLNKVGSLRPVTRLQARRPAGIRRNFHDHRVLSVVGAASFYLLDALYNDDKETRAADGLFRYGVFRLGAKQCRHYGGHGQPFPTTRKYRSRTH